MQRRFGGALFDWNPPLADFLADLPVGSAPDPDCSDR